MKVSVIIPVYNAASYVEEAVASALAQPETGEVLLVEDGSTDSSLAICQRLAAQSHLVRLLQHPDGKNLGTGASRNLGISVAACPLIAFLDADDYYLPARFDRAMKVLASHSDADGVYEITDVFFQDDASRQRWKNSGWPAKIGLRCWVEPELLFETLATGGAGSFCTDGIVVRRSLFEKSGYFKTNLRTGQDTHLWLRMAAVGKLYSGQTDRPVSMCRIHAENRVTGRSREGQQEAAQKVWEDLIQWCRAQNLPAHWIDLLMRRYAATSNGLVMQRPWLKATQEAFRSCVFLIRHGAHPWRVEGFFHLLMAASGIWLAWQRMVDFASRHLDRRDKNPS